jgi:hypothetical protein
MVRLTVLIFLLLTSVAFAQQKPEIQMHRTQVADRDKSGWYPAVSTLGSFKASLPLPFNDFTIKANDPKVGVIVTHAVGCKSSDGFKLSITEMQIGSKMESPDLDAIVDNLKGKGNKVTDVDRSPYLGFEVISFAVSASNGGAFMKYIKTKNSLLSATLEYPAGGRESAIKLKSRFFDSIQFKPAGGMKITK